jgi:hypothetical protein
MAAEFFSFTTQGVEFVNASLATRYFGREDLATYFPDPRESGWMFEALALLEDGLPLPPAFGPFRVGSFYRMPQHRRSCCLSRLRPGGEVARSAIRSTERYCFDSLRESLLQASKAGSALEPRVAAYFFANATLERLYSILDKHLVP